MGGYHNFVSKGDFFWGGGGLFSVLIRLFNLVFVNVSSKIRTATNRKLISNTINSKVKFQKIVFVCENCGISEKQFSVCLTKTNLNSTLDKVMIPFLWIFWLVVFWSDTTNTSKGPGSFHPTIISPPTHFSSCSFYLAASNSLFYWKSRNLNKRN